MPDMKDKLFYANNVYFVWNTVVTLIDTLRLPDEVEKKLSELFFCCNDFMTDIGTFEVKTFAIEVDDE